MPGGWGWNRGTIQLCMDWLNIDRVIPARIERKAEGIDKIHVSSWKGEDDTYHTAIWDKSLSREDIKKDLERSANGRWLTKKMIIDYGGVGFHE